jgi:ATP-binding cassette subfamily B protein
VRFALAGAGFPFYPQLYSTDCGAACLRMIARHYGRHYDAAFLRARSFLTRDGVSLLGIGEAAEAIGMRTLAVRVPFEKLKRAAPLPCIVHWRQNHFVVVYRIGGGRVHVADPSRGLVAYTEEEFLEAWRGAGAHGIALLVEPTEQFFDREPEAAGTPPTGLALLQGELWRHRALLAQVLIGMAFISGLQLVFPFLTQALVDHGVNGRNVGFIYVVLLSQLMLFMSRTAVELVRNRIVSHVGERMNVSLISNFLAKLTRLPLGFFERRLLADLLQRVVDQRRISTFFSSGTVEVLFSVLSFLVFGTVLATYSGRLLVVFLLGGAAVAVWVSLFAVRRGVLDRARFSEQSRSQSHLIQLIQGMAELKLNGAATQKRWEWERAQTRLFRTEMQSQALLQLQNGGMQFLNELKNIVISVLAAQQVVAGHMTLGMMMAVSYIVGQLNAPVAQLMNFLAAGQDAHLSLDRLAEVHGEAEEVDVEAEEALLVPAPARLRLSGVSFQYEGPRSPRVLQDLDLDIPAGRVTAIVGASGSGKTTLLKILLRLYEPTEGQIRLGPSPFTSLPLTWWRSQCGVVMQNGFVFSDTIRGNITLGDEQADSERFLRAVEIAKVAPFAEALPLGYGTRIGEDGAGLSEGQKQRILIARAVYKNPAYLLFDEATSALDASNERSIMEDLEEFFAGKTVVIVAHRLSTVKRAHQIAVLHKGRIVERGTHAELVEHRGTYYALVKDQLELGA